MMRKGAISQNVNQHITSFINKSSEFGGGGWEETAKLHSTLSDLPMFLSLQTCLAVTFFLMLNPHFQHPLGQFPMVIQLINQS